MTAPRRAPTEATRRWAAVLRQIFEVDPLVCPTCHGTMRILAVITQAAVIDQILTHRRTRAAAGARPGARSPPSTAVSVARGTRATRRRPTDDRPRTPSPSTRPAGAEGCPAHPGSPQIPIPIGLWIVTLSAMGVLKIVG